MSWWNNIENDVSSWFGKRPQTPQTPQTPKDPEAPIKGLMAGAPQLGGQAGANKAMENQLLNGTFKKGGTVKETGIYKLHKGEKVIPKKKAMAKKMPIEKRLERAGKRLHRGARRLIEHMTPEEEATQQDYYWNTHQ